MGDQPIDDIETWSKTLSPWRRDCLRRLAISSELTEDDLNELLALIKAGAGFDLTKPPPKPIAFKKAHFGCSSYQPVVLKGISNVENINRLASQASLAFCPKALTVVYGRNGSGKSGFVRILRTACRTRVENPAKLRVLANVYGGSSGPQSATIIIDTGSGDTPLKWAPGMDAAPALSQVAVFDSASAQLYVDGGNQIKFLPFGLALPHRLNSACITLKEKLEAERQVAVGNKVALTAIAFNAVRGTKAQTFEKTITHKTTEAEIKQAATFGAEEQERLAEVTNSLPADLAASADISALATWLAALANECQAAETAFDDAALAELTELKDKAVAARGAAQLAASSLFTNEPLPGVGSDSWRVLWEAARDYSVNEAYVSLKFPVTMVVKGNATCVLCQQPLHADAAARMLRFQKYMDDILDVAATSAEKAVSVASQALLEFEFLSAADFLDRNEQIRKRNPGLADALIVFQKNLLARRTDALSRLAGKPNQAMTALISPVEALKSLEQRIQADKEALVKAASSAERAKLIAEKAELEDLKVLATNRDRLLTRRQLLLVDAAYSVALAEVQTRAITQRANELVDKHLTSAVVAQFEAERTCFDIAHLKIGLSRKSGQTRAEFEVDTQTKLTKVTSEILSEGEQRALALAGFLTEVALTDGSGPIVVDDPVSSLDRERTAQVANRLAEEAKHRQVVVFTHDIIFFNDLCRAADGQGIEPVTIALFSDKKAAGKVDQAGMVWKGLNVAKRIARIRQDFAPLPKLQNTSPAD